MKPHAVATDYPRIAGREAALGLLSSTALHDMETFRHLHSTAHTTHLLAIRLGLAKGDVELAYAAALFHDVGKLDVPTSILRKPAALTAEEWLVVREHPVASARYLEGIGEPDLAAIVLHHHEMLDGSGYPHGLRGSAIPATTQIVSVADAYDTMRYRRAYKIPRSHEDVMAELVALSGVHYDGAIVDALGRAMEDEADRLDGKRA